MKSESRLAEKYTDPHPCHTTPRLAVTALLYHVLFSRSVSTSVSISRFFYLGGAIILCIILCIIIIYAVVTVLVIV